MTRITQAPFGATKDGRPVVCWTMKNDRGMTVRVLDYGCTVQSVIVPDRQGAPVDVVLGYDDIAGYEAGTCWFGAFVGRYANRIKGAAFILNGKEYVLPKNDGENHLHGTFDRRSFRGAAEDGKLVLRYLSPDGEEGYPGNLSVTVTYALTEENALVMDYRAETDADTVLNLTNHSYFNLDGQTGGDILDHHLTLASSFYTEAEDDSTLTGRILPVDGTALDFRGEGKTLREGLADGVLLAWPCQGFDHNMILDKGPGLVACGEVYSAVTGIAMTFSTTQPAAQLYGGNFVAGDGAACGKGGLRYPRNGGLCLESQHYPCSPNIPAFPSAVLRPGEEYHETTAYRFGIKEL